MRIPRNVRCPNPDCGIIFNIGMRDSVRFKCPCCRWYHNIWDFKEFYTTNHMSGLFKVDYKDVEPLLIRIRNKHFNFVCVEGE